MTDYSDMELEEIQQIQAEEKKAYQKYQREAKKLGKLREALQAGEKVSFQDIMNQNDKMVDAMTKWVYFFPNMAALNNEKISKEEKEPKVKKSTRKKKEVV